MYRIIVKRVASLFGLPCFSGWPEYLNRERRREPNGQFSLRALLVATMLAGVLGGKAGDHWAREAERKRIDCDMGEVIKQRQKEIGGGGWSRAGPRSLDGMPEWPAEFDDWEFSGWERD